MTAGREREIEIEIEREGEGEREREREIPYSKGTGGHRGCFRV